MFLSTKTLWNGLRQTEQRVPVRGKHNSCSLEVIFWQFTAQHAFLREHSSNWSLESGDILLGEGWAYLHQDNSAEWAQCVESKHWLIQPEDGHLDKQEPGKRGERQPYHLARKRDNCSWTGEKLQTLTETHSRMRLICRWSIPLNSELHKFFSLKVFTAIICQIMNTCIINLDKVSAMKLLVLTSSSSIIGISAVPLATPFMTLW